MEDIPRAIDFTDVFGRTLPVLNDKPCLQYASSFNCAVKTIRIIEPVMGNALSFSIDSEPVLTATSGFPVYEEIAAKRIKGSPLFSWSGMVM